MTTPGTKLRREDAGTPRQPARGTRVSEAQSIKSYLHGIGRSAVYASKDRKWIITEHPDGRVEKKRLAETPLIEPLPHELVTLSGKPSRRD